MTNLFDSRPIENAKFLVTGGAGFIGSHIVEILLDQGFKVVVLDNFSSGKHENVPDHKDVLVLDADICDWETLSTNLDAFEGIYGVFHCAAEARIQPCIKEPRKAFDANALGTFNILEIMRMAGIPAIVYSASSSSYGRKNRSPLREDMTPDPLNIYATTKLVGEELCKTYGKSYGIWNTSLKYFNVYGPRSPTDIGAYSPVIGLFFKQALAGKPMTIVGDGTQKRDFTYVTDVAHANLLSMLLLMRDGQNAAGNGVTLNIGTGINYSILEIAHMIQAVLRRERPNSAIVHIAERPGESLETLADLTLTRKCIENWNGPTYTPHVALELLRSHYLEQFDGRKSVSSTKDDDESGANQAQEQHG